MAPHRNVYQYINLVFGSESAMIKLTSSQLQCRYLLSKWYGSGLYATLSQRLTMM
jgi:hypothetical protein